MAGKSANSPRGAAAARSRDRVPSQSGKLPDPGRSETDLQAWHEKILAVQGDDKALLQLAHQAPGVELKLAALAGVTQEDALRQAEREFRDHDKRVYRAAKSRWQTAVARREAAAEAQVLIADARALIEQGRIPDNRLVELDRAWAALNRGALEQEAIAEFQAVRERLGADLRERSEVEQALGRWLPAVDAAMHALSASLPGVAGGEAAPATPSSAPAALAETLMQLLNQIPGASEAAIDARCVEKTEAANRVLALASSVALRAEFLQSLPAAIATDEADEKAKIEQWRDFPEVSEGDLQTLLAHRFSGWRNACGEERKREHDARRAQERELSAEQRKQRLDAMQRQVELAEAAHAAGQVSELTRLLAAIDDALKSGPANPALAKRIESLRQEQLRLRDWQRWSGGQRREELVAEAQALAKAAGEKAALKAHADAIDKLRERWRELDKLGGATNKALWLAFDGALKAAYAPVATHLEKLRVARNENLLARKRVIEGLVQGQAKFFPAAPEAGNSPAPAAGNSPAPASAASDRPDWRAVARALEEAKIAWRKLGPVEHTVPRAAQKGDGAVTARYATALQALEAPLTQAYREASQEREQLIAAAKALGESQPPARDAIDRVRGLQAKWQTHAKALPLPRREENTLWSAFKAATDAIFTARDAARTARESEAGEKIKAREAIIASLRELPTANSAASAADIKRALASAETAWRACAEVPRPQAAGLEARYRAAREAATKRLREIAEHAAHSRFDALIAAMRTCDELEAAGEITPDLEARWSAVENLPDAWKRAMEARFRGIDAPRVESNPRSGANSTAALPDILLNLEVACGLDSPAEFLAARQQLKMRALKDVMEGRGSGATRPEDIERRLLDAAASPRPDEVSRVRLEKIIAAVRVRPRG